MAKDPAEIWAERIGWWFLQGCFYGSVGLVIAGLLLGWPWMWAPGVLVGLGAGVAAIEFRRMENS